MWLLILLIALLILVPIYWQLREDKLLKTVTSKRRGTWSERDLVIKLLKKGFPAENIFHDLYVNKIDGSFSQIDIVLVTEVGIIVVEVKHYSGWIFGVGYNSQWAQVLAYGKKKYSFYNPILQNESHIQSLKSKLSKFGDIPFYSLIVFYGNCVLKSISFVPNEISIVKSNNTLDTINNILQNNIQSNSVNTTEISKLLREAVKNGEEREIRIRHIENIRNMQRFNKA